MLTNVSVSKIWHQKSGVTYHHESGVVHRLFFFKDCQPLQEHCFQTLAHECKERDEFIDLKRQHLFTDTHIHIYIYTRVLRHDDTDLEQFFAQEATAEHQPVGLHLLPHQVQQGTASHSACEVTLQGPSSNTSAPLCSVRGRAGTAVAATMAAATSKARSHIADLDARPGLYVPEPRKRRCSLVCANCSPL